MARLVGLPKFIYLEINFSDHLDQQITDPFFQINSPNKRQTHRKKVLSLTLSVPYRGHYITMPNLERF